MVYKKSKYDIEVDNLLKENEIILKRLGRGDYKEYRKNRSDGEKIVARTLQELGYRYVPEYATPHLKYDKKQNRFVDFYLPKEKIYLEFCGGWDRDDKEKRRYEEKRDIYEINGLKYLFIYPKDLYNITRILDREIKKLIKINVQPKEVLCNQCSSPMTKLGNGKCFKCNLANKKARQANLNSTIDDFKDDLNYEPELDLGLDKPYICGVCGRPMAKLSNGNCFHCNKKAKALREKKYSYSSKNYKSNKNSNKLKKFFIFLFLGFVVLAFFQSYNPISCSSTLGDIKEKYGEPFSSSMAYDVDLKKETIDLLYSTGDNKGVRFVLENTNEKRIEDLTILKIMKFNKGDSDVTICDN